MKIKEISIQVASEFDAAKLAKLAENAFRSAFAHLNDRDNLESYIERSFTETQIKFEIRDSASIFFIARIGNTWAGYAKLHQGTPPECVTPFPAIELARLYSLQAFLRCGIGSELITACITYAKREGFRSIWLGSWKENSRANAFYTKMQFDIVGTTSFALGSEVQEDFVFTKSLL